jgi:hypothetical protein
MKEIDLWLDDLLLTWEARFDTLDDYITKIQNDRNYANSRKP